MEEIVKGKHLKHLYFELLEYLSDYGIGIDANIKDLCTQYAIKELKHEVMDDAFKAFSKRWNEIITVLESIKKLGYIKYSTEHSDITRLYIVDGNFSVSITKEGLDYYYTHALRRATLKSFWNQKWFNIATVSIAGASLIASVVITLYTTNQNTILSDKVTKLDSQVQQLKSLQHSQVATHKIPGNGR
jgi:hypothetical protein